MANDSADLEEQCEDAVFELSDTRERYPKKCAELFKQSLQLESQIAMQPVELNKPKKLPKPVITDYQKELFNKFMEKNLSNDLDKYKKMTNEIQNLRIILDQMKRDKSSSIN
ncbi:hypothetical protein HCN44_010634 [Aphidius gifuensis]|uniref:Uncharacterized protein n=1 Tax=Aphidius gifuensis TaxID=684658 RepID=A0A835CS23_APHGI|nr:uncharacterized protein LOC122854061 [Aphidius gifuensis]KAF7991833.1 hypothetical protein HCN44_010634 [Aphidius gifuensis]